MTVRELIEELKEFDEDSEVIVNIGKKYESNEYFKSRRTSWWSGDKELTNYVIIAADTDKYIPTWIIESGTKV